MARTKVKLECHLKSWGDVDEAMKRLAECERIRDGLTSDMNAELDAVKNRYAAMTAPVLERIAHYNADVCEFVTQHRGDMEGKTKELNFGSTGFRISTKLKYNRGVKSADVVAALLRLKLKDCIKTTQTVITDALRKKPADVLNEVGAYLDKEDAFWLETKRETIQPAKESEVVS